MLVTAKLYQWKMCILAKTKVMFRSLNEKIKMPTSHVLVSNTKYVSF